MIIGLCKVSGFFVLMLRLRLMAAEGSLWLMDVYFGPCRGIIRRLNKGLRGICFSGLNGF